ncbi:MAG: DUF362 domain-containing protein [Anaerolineales bacterium]
MAKLSRRDFLRRSAAGLGALTAAGILAACDRALSATTLPAGANTSLPRASTDTPLPAAPTDTALPLSTATVPVPTATPLVVPDLAVAHGGSDPEALVRAALAALGGMPKFVQSGAKVIIKPNICVAHPYQYAATTNPWVVGALVKMCLEAGAGSVQVMDSPFGCSEQEGYQTSGIRQQVEAAGGQMVYMPLFKYVKTPIPSGLDLKQIEVFEDILKADLVINVPIAKNHDLSLLTLGMKNLMGVILNRPGMHINIGQRLADLTSLVKPKLTVVDAVRILVAGGPGGGDLKDVKELDTVIASTDIVAADSYTATLFNMQPSDLSYIVAGAAMGLGRSDLQNLKIEQIPVGS